LFNSSGLVDILVGPKHVRFTLPKDLLCHNSVWFKDGFSSRAEGTAIHLKCVTVNAVQMMVQLLYTGRITLSEGLRGADRVTAYLEFATLGHLFYILGYVTPVVDGIRDALVTSCFGKNSRQQSDGYGSDCTSISEQEDCRCTSDGRRRPGCDRHIDPINSGVLTRQHIITAFTLPPAHEVRKLIAEACVVAFLLSFPEDPDKPFKFNKELDTVDGFSKEVLRAVGSSVQTTREYGAYRVRPVNPITSKKIVLNGRY
jgi:hypothetical protein